MKRIAETGKEEAENTPTMALQFFPVSEIRFPVSVLAPCHEFRIVTRSRFSLDPRITAG